MSIKIISPSNYKPGICHITQGWPNYHEGKAGKILKHHTGIDIGCGIGNMRDARAYAVETGKVIRIVIGTKRRSGYVMVQGNPSGHYYIYRHLGKYKRNTGGIFVEVGDEIKAGDEIGTPDYSRTKFPHLHFSVLAEDMKTELDPVRRLIQVLPYLKYSFSTSLFVKEYYEKTNPELLQLMEAA